MTKRSATTHWVTYDGINRVACGKRQTVGGAKLRVTADHTKATCKTCVRIATESPPTKRVHEVQQYAHDAAFADTVLGPTDATQLRMQYAGAIGLLCTLSTQLSRNGERADNLDSIELAVADFCKLTGWSYRRIVHRIEVFLPATKGANEHGKG